jgi:DNA-binding HxlR family transcriptional regulator
MKKTLPGHPARGSPTGRPVMVLLDLLGRRMALRVIWELSQAETPLTFRALQNAAGTNPGVLNARLRELREARIVDRADGGYVLSDDGRSLLTTIMPLQGWAEAWAARLGEPSG